MEKSRVKDLSIKNTELEDVKQPQETSGRPVTEKELSEANSLSHLKETWLARRSTGRGGKQGQKLSQ